MSIQRFQLKKAQGQKISMVTCYDYPSAKLVSQTSIDCILVGDSLAMTVHGFSSTIHATLDMMILHTQAVSRGLGKQFLITDMPFMAHRSSVEMTVSHALKLLQAGAHAIKIEGADDFTCGQISHLVESGVPVVGHIGLQPQSILAYGAYKVQGRAPEHAKRLLEEAIKLQDAGCFALVLECIPADLAAAISKRLRIATIGIGAGSGTDGQVLVWHDLLRLQSDILPKFVKPYQATGETIVQALETFHQEVQLELFPTSEYAY